MIFIGRLLLRQKMHLIQIGNTYINPQTITFVKKETDYFSVWFSGSMENWLKLPIEHWDIFIKEFRYV
jgi:hypothetical protein